MKTSLLALLAFAACGDDPINYSQPVGIELKTKSSDAVNNAIDAEKNINTESGNPYGAFVTEAKNRIGHDPSRIELEKLTITLNGAGSTNVANLNEIMTGDDVVQFVMNDTNDTYVAGRFGSPSGVGPVDGTINFSWDMVADQNIAKFISGSFKVVLVAPAATGWMGKGAEADLQLTFTFSAFE